MKFFRDTKMFFTPPKAQYEWYIVYWVIWNRVLTANGDAVLSVKTAIQNKYYKNNEII